MREFLGFNYSDENDLADGKKRLREILINETSLQIIFWFEG